MKDSSGVSLTSPVLAPVEKSTSAAPGTNLPAVIRRMKRCKGGKILGPTARNHRVATIFAIGLLGPPRGRGFGTIEILERFDDLCSPSLGGFVSEFFPGLSFERSRHEIAPQEIGKSAVGLNSCPECRPLRVQAAFRREPRMEAELVRLDWSLMGDEPVDPRGDRTQVAAHHRPNEAPAR